VRRDAIHLAAGGKLGGPAHETELVDPALPRRALPALQARVVAAVLLAAVVGQEDHDRVVGQLELVKLGQQAADVVVDVLNHAIDSAKHIRVVARRHRMPRLGKLVRGKILFPMTLAVLVRDLVRRVRTVEGQIHKERLIAGLLNELDGRVGDHVADVPLGLDPLAVVAERGVEIGSPFVHRVRRIAGLGQSASAQHQRFLKPLVHGPHRVVVAQVPFAEDPCAIAAGSQHLGQRRFVGMHQRTPQEGVDHAGAVVIPSRHQARPRWRTDGHDVKLGQRDALPRQTVDMRSANDRIARRAKFAEALIVRQDDDHVRFGCRVRRQGERRQQTQRDQQRQKENGNGSHDLVLQVIPGAGSRSLTVGVGRGRSSLPAGTELGQNPAVRRDGGGKAGARLP